MKEIKLYLYFNSLFQNQIKGCYSTIYQNQTFLAQSKEGCYLVICQNKINLGVHSIMVQIYLKDLSYNCLIIIFL